MNLKHSFLEELVAFRAFGKVPVCWDAFTICFCHPAVEMASCDGIVAAGRWA